MINRFVFTGRDAHDRPILVGMELQLQAKQVELLIFGREGLPEEFPKALHEQWEKGQELAFPAEPERIIRPAGEEHLLPLEIRADRPELISRIQNEWTLKLLSYKLYESIVEEVGGLQTQLENLGSYSQDLWDKTKATWDQVSNHAQDFNLSRNHAQDLRERINKVFEQLKKMREGGQAEFEQASAALRTGFEATLQELQDRLRDQVKVNELFDQLRNLQKQIRDARMTHRDRRVLWNRLDEQFELLKKQKDNLWQSHLSNRIKGLEDAMKKIQQSVDRDRSNLDFEARKLESGRIGQLEHQLRATRMKVTEDRIRGKEEKLADMHRTLQQLKKKEAAQRKKAEAAAAPAPAEAPEAAAAPAATEAPAASAPPPSEPQEPDPIQAPETPRPETPSAAASATSQSSEGQAEHPQPEQQPDQAEDEAEKA
jgi:hypothetical protein